MIILFSILYVNYQESNLKKYGEYTTATLMEYKGCGNRICVGYYYFVNGDSIYSRETVDTKIEGCEWNRKCIRKKFKVKYSTKWKTNAKIFLNSPVE